MDYLRGIANVLAYIWQLPQNLLGLLAVAILGGKSEMCFGHKVYLTDEIDEDYCLGVSLGNYIIYERSDVDEQSIKHEYGHQIQSLILGPLYLIVIGLPSLIWAAFRSSSSKKSYCSFYTEKWADKLGGVER